MIYKSPGQSFFTGLTRGLEMGLKFKEARLKKEQAQKEAESDAIKLDILRQKNQRESEQHAVKMKSDLLDLEKKKIDTAAYPQEKALDFQKKSLDNLSTSQDIKQSGEKHQLDMKKGQYDLEQKRIDTESYSVERQQELVKRELENRKLNLDNIGSEIEYYESIGAAQIGRRIVSLAQETAKAKAMKTEIDMIKGDAKSVEDMTPEQIIAIQNTMSRYNLSANQIFHENLDGLNGNGDHTEFSGAYVPGQGGEEGEGSKTFTPLLNVYKQAQPGEATDTQMLPATIDRKSGSQPIEVDKDQVEEIAYGTIEHGLMLQALYHDAQRERAVKEVELNELLKYTNMMEGRGLPGDGTGESGSVGQGQSPVGEFIPFSTLKALTDPEDDRIVASFKSLMVDKGIAKEESGGESLIMLDNGREVYEGDFINNVMGITMTISNSGGKENVHPRVTMPAALAAAYQGDSAENVDTNLIPRRGWEALEFNVLSDREKKTLKTSLLVLFKDADVPEEFRVPKSIRGDNQGRAPSKEEAANDDKYDEAAREAYGHLLATYLGNGYVPFEVLKEVYGDAQAFEIKKQLRAGYDGTIADGG